MLILGVEPNLIAYKTIVQTDTLYELNIPKERIISLTIISNNASNFYLIFILKLDFCCMLLSSPYYNIVFSLNCFIIL